MLAKYQQLALDLERQIGDGRLAAGAQLPTEQALAAEYGVARGTVRKALAQLERKGFIYTEQGSGSFVRRPWKDAVPFQFSEPHAEAEQAISYRVLRQEVLPVPLELAPQLNILPGTAVIYIAQHKCIDNEIVSYAERYLPEALCPALLHADLTNHSVHDFLLTHAEAPPVRATITLSTTQLEARDAALLAVAPGTHCIVVHRLSYTEPTRPAVWFRGLFRHGYTMGVELLEPRKEQ